MDTILRRSVGLVLFGDNVTPPGDHKWSAVEFQVYHQDCPHGQYMCLFTLTVNGQSHLGPHLTGSVCGDHVILDNVDQYAAGIATLATTDNVTAHVNSFLVLVKDV